MPVYEEVLIDTWSHSKPLYSRISCTAIPIGAPPRQMPTRKVGRKPLRTTCKASSMESRSSDSAEMNILSMGSAGIVVLRMRSRRYGSCQRNLSKYNVNFAASRWRSLTSRRCVFAILRPLADNLPHDHGADAIGRFHRRIEARITCVFLEQVLRGAHTGRRHGVVAGRAQHHDALLVDFARGVQVSQGLKSA